MYLFISYEDINVTTNIHYLINPTLKFFKQVTFKVWTGNTRHQNSFTSLQKFQQKRTSDSQPRHLYAAETATTSLTTTLPKPEEINVVPPKVLAQVRF